MNKKITIAQIGLGNWGKNLFKNFSLLSDCQMKYGCDLDPEIIEAYTRDYPQARFTNNYEQVLADPAVEAIVVATPAPAHFKLAKMALEKGKHVFVEKPITLDVGHADELVNLAKKVNKKLMVGHLLLYQPAITRLKKIVQNGDLGNVYYLYTQRLNLGKVRNTENAMWSLAPHDISVVLHLLGKSPVSVSALGAAYVQNDIEDVVFISIRFDSGEIANVHVSWLDPTKTRKTIVVGSKKMAVFDEVNDNTLSLFDRGADHQSNGKVNLRSGNAEIVKDIAKEAPLKLECQHFIDCITKNQEPLSNGQNGLEVLKVLAAADRSLKNGGKNELL